MGKVEKVVVLSVLFLITLILVVSLSSTPESLAQKQRERGSTPDRVESEPPVEKLMLAAVQPQDPTVLPLGAEPARAELGETGAQQAAGAPAPVAQPAPAIASAGAPAIASAAESLPAGALLVTLQGLAPSYLDEYRFYTWSAGDTWGSVAEHCYRDASRADLLQQANEGRPRIQPGEKILVPVFGPAAASPRESATVAALPGPASGGAKAGEAYVVVEGDSLWRIAKKQYGNGARWKEIYEANRDVLPSADALAAGQRLRIP